MKNGSSSAPERFFTTKSDSSERSKTQKTVTNSNKLSFENLKLNRKYFFPYIPEQFTAKIIANSKLNFATQSLLSKKVKLRR